MKSRNLWVLMVTFTIIFMAILAAFMPLNVMLADDNEQHFLPIIFGGRGEEDQATPSSTSSATVAATTTLTPTSDSTDTPPTATAEATATDAPTSTSTPTSRPCMSGEGNVIRNGGLESKANFWVLHNDGRQEWELAGPAYECRFSAKLALDNVGNNVQFNQARFNLKDNTYYRLTFAAKSNTGNDFRVFIHKNTAPYTDFGIGGPQFNLTDEWQQFSQEFLSKNISGESNDSRIRFWFKGLAADGDMYWIDAVKLQELGPGPTPVATNTPQATATSQPTRTPRPGTTPTNTPRPQATNTPGSGGGGRELLVYDWNGRVTEANRGFPWKQPPRNNFDWTKPVNYAGGTLHYHVTIRSQPVPQDMRLQFCFWQEKNGDKFGLENCGPLKSVRGNRGVTANWSVKVSDMWKLNGKPIEWHRPRFRVAAVVKNKNGLPVSNFLGWNWNGEDPKKWYPIDWHFKVVVVAPGATFSGWENYIDE